MPSIGGNTISNTGIILERIESLKCDVVDIGRGFEKISTALTDLRVTYTGGHAQVVADTTAHKEMLADHEKRLKELEQVLSDFKTIKAIAIYMSVVFTGFVLTLVWEIITHKITLAF